MRFAMTCSDRYLGVFEGLLRAGWSPEKLFLVPVQGPVDLNRHVLARATKLGIEVQISKMTDRDLADLGARGCEALVVASYNWRIGDWRPHLKYAVNFHCSPLPTGRGPYPTIQAILEERDTWGVTCHKLERNFDAGDVLAQELFPLSKDECQESLDLKVQMAAGRLTTQITGRFVELWTGAKAQGEGSYWKRPTDADRVIDFARPVEAILRHVRAFGSAESTANVSGATVSVRRANGWTEAHSHTPGKVVHVSSSQHAIVVAAADGYVALMDWQLRQQAVLGASARSLAQTPAGDAVARFTASAASTEARTGQPGPTR